MKAKCRLSWQRSRKKQGRKKPFYPSLILANVLKPIHNSTTAGLIQFMRGCISLTLSSSLCVEHSGSELQLPSLPFTWGDHLNSSSPWKLKVSTPTVSKVSVLKTNSKWFISFTGTQKNGQGEETFCCLVFVYYVVCVCLLCLLTVRLLVS